MFADPLAIIAAMPTIQKARAPHWPVASRLIAALEPTG